MNQKHHILLATIIVATIGIYFQTLSFDFVNWDDDYYVTNNLQVSNPTIHNLALFFTQGNTANYHPITMLSLALNYAIGGENATGYHLFNLLFHLLNTILLYLWVKNLWPKQMYLPLIIASIFALHPMHVESVAWISSRKDVLFFFFYFLGLLSYHHFYRQKKTKYFIYTLGFFMLSALSKPTAVIFPIHLLLIDYLLNIKISFRLLVEKTPFIIVSILIGLATIYVQTDAGAVNIDAYSLIERIQLASYAINLYVIKFFLPTHLSSFYPYPLLPFDTLVSIAPFISIGVGGLLFWRFRLNRNMVFGMLFFLISILLLVQLVTVGSTIISERYTYLAYVGLSISIYFIIEQLISKHLNFQGNTFLIISSLILLSCTWVSFNRIKVWENGETLWTDAIDKFPQVAGSWGGRGVYYRLEKKYTKALKDLNQAVFLNPNEPMFYSNRGNIFFDLGKDDEALLDYNNCIRLDSTDENAYANRGAIFGRRGKYDQALNDLNTAIRISPNIMNTYMNRGIIYSQMNQRNLAKNDFKTCISLDPDNDGIWNAIAVEHQHLGDFDSSIVVLNKAIAMNNSEGIYYFNRGISYRLLGNQVSAIKDFNTATSLGITVDPGYYQATQ